MRTRLFVTLLTPFFLLLTCLSARAKEAPKSDTRFAAIAPAVDAFIRQKKLAGAVTLVAQEGEILHLQAHGLADIASEKPMATDAIFRIHSMTKAIVTAAALMLYEESRFAFDDPVSKYLPAFAGRADLSQITVRSLMRHTSGLSYAFTAPQEIARKQMAANIWSGDLEDFAQRLATVPLVHPPDQGWTYGVSIDVLGYLIETWSGMRLDDFLKERIFDPLGMVDTGFYVPEPKRDRLAALYTLTEDGDLIPANSPFSFDLFTRPKLCSGGGGLLSTATDYFRFLQMILDAGSVDGTQLLSADSVALMTTNQLPKQIPSISVTGEKRTGIGFGFGFSVVTVEAGDWDPDGKLDEFGWGGAASCHYWVSPQDRLIVVTLEQTQPYGWTLEWGLKPMIYEAIADSGP